MKSSPESIAFLLTGGGARAAYQLGVLKYLFTELKIEPKSPVFSGTSAGAINAYYLAMHADKGYDKAIIELCELWEGLTVNRIYKTDPWTILKTIGNFLFNFTLGRIVKERHIESLLDSRPLYQFLRDISDKHYHKLHENIKSGKVKALGISVLEFGTGKTITFFETDPSSGIHPWSRPRREGRESKIRLKHILASAAIPLAFPAVKLGKYYYGDGSVRRMSPLSPAIHLGASKICAVGLRTDSSRMRPSESYPSVSQIMGMMFNTVFLDALDYDVRVLGRLNHVIDQHKHIEGVRSIDVNLIRPSVDLAMLSLPYKKYAPKILSFLLKGLGPTDKSGADLLSYILFDKHYIKALIDQGMKDAHAQRTQLLSFFGSISKKKVA